MSHEKLSLKIKRMQLGMQPSFSHRLHPSNLPPRLLNLSRISLDAPFVTVMKPACQLSSDRNTMKHEFIWMIPHQRWTHRTSEGSAPLWPAAVLVIGSCNITSVFPLTWFLDLKMFVWMGKKGPRGCSDGLSARVTSSGLWSDVEGGCDRCI